MGANDHALDDLAGAILDGTAIDWASAESGAADMERPLVDRLHLLAAIADFHRDLLTAPPSTDDVRWGHLRVLGRIGRGAFGEVYRAWDTRLDREVALKLLNAAPPLGDRCGTSIIEEGRLLARVRHPNVVTIYGAEHIDDRIGLWMEFVNGRTLEQVLEQDGALSPATVVTVGVELSRAVAAVHGAGLLHRDVKARNVMLAEDGRVVLMDFGTGREVGQGGTGLAGTPLYLAPELLAGAEASVGSDIYSVGVVLYHLLTGSYPVAARDLADLHLAHQRRGVIDVRAVRPDVAPKLARIIERSIDPRPENRHESADALAADLTALTAGPRAAPLAYALAYAAVIALVVWVGSRMGHPAAGALTAMSTAVPTGAGGTPGAKGLDPSVRPIVAVLPLKNLSAEPDSDYFVDGLTDELIRNLAVIDGLEVRSRTSSFFFKDKPRNLQDVVEQLGVNLVLEGSVLRSGRKLRVNAQLVAVAGDTALWSQRFDGDVKDVFAIQNEISRAIVNRLRLMLGRGQRRYDINVDAYATYLKARGLVDRRFGDVEEAAKLFRQVTAEDPDFAPAYAGLASAYAFMSMSPYGTGVSLAMAQSVMRPSAARALQLDPLLAEAHAAEGVVHASDRDWAAADTSFRRALELNPGLTQSYTSYVFWALEPLGRLGEADRLLRVALRLDPLSLDVRREMGRVHFQAGRYEQAVGEFEHVKAIDPKFPNIDGFLGRSLIFAGRLPEAIALLEPQGDTGEQFLAMAYVLAGRRSDALKIAALHRHHPIDEARIYTALRDKDRAFEALSRAMVAEPYRVAMVLQYPEMAGLQGDPRLRALRQTLNLPPEPAADRQP